MLEEQQKLAIPWFPRIFGRFLRLFFRLLYHEMACSYDLVAALVSLGRWKSWVVQVIPFIDGERILELGHGPGHLQLSVFSKGIAIYGLDESRQMGRQAYRRIRNAGLGPRLVNGIAQSLPFPTMTFDQVAATFPSEYIVMPEALAEIRRVLVPGGELIILPIAWITGKRWYERLAAWLFRFTGQAPDITTISRSEKFKEIFLEAGFEAHSQLLEIPGATLLLVRATRQG